MQLWSVWCWMIIHTWIEGRVFLVTALIWKKMWSLHHRENLRRRRMVEDLVHAFCAEEIGWNWKLTDKKSIYKSKVKALHCLSLLFLLWNGKVLVVSGIFEKNLWSYSVASTEHAFIVSWWKCLVESNGCSWKNKQKTLVLVLNHIINKLR